MGICQMEMGWNETTIYTDDEEGAEAWWAWHGMAGWPD